MNKKYSVCPSYPPVVIVPKGIDDETLKKVAKFRQGGRFPVLCYYHRKNGMVRGSCCLIEWLSRLYNTLEISYNFLPFKGQTSIYLIPISSCDRQCSS